MKHITSTLFIQQRGCTVNMNGLLGLIFCLGFLLIVGVNTETANPKTILIVSCWQKSHIIALQGLAEELVLRGHKVLFSTTGKSFRLFETNDYRGGSTSHFEYSSWCRISRRRQSS